MPRPAQHNTVYSSFFRSFLSFLSKFLILYVCSIKQLTSFMSLSLRCYKVEASVNARRSLCEIPSNRRYERGLLAEPWRPFLTLDDFKLANWFVTSKVLRSLIDEYFTIGLSKSTSPCVKSPYKLDQYITALDPYQHFLEWKEGIYKNDSYSSTFFYRDIVQSVEYLLSQPAYRDDIVYAPVREQNETGERL